MAADTATTGITVRLRDVEQVLRLYTRLEEVIAEMEAANPNNHPIQWHSKAKWQQVVMDATEFVQKLLPKTEGS